MKIDHVAVRAEDFDLTVKMRSSLDLTIALVLLISCQSEEQRPVVSIEDAKQITARFGDVQVEAPPRTITDITDLLVD